MSGRRGFLAFVGGFALGGTAVKVEAASRPTLILPVRPALVAATELPTQFPLLAQHRTQMDAILHTGMGVPDQQFKAWLEAGLRMAEAHGRRRV